MKLAHACALLLAPVALTASPRVAFAAGCPTSDRPVIVLSTEVTPPDQFIAEALERHLTAELAARAIDLCSTAPDPRLPIGTVFLRIEHPPQGRVTATIRIGDEVTDKRVERTMDLTNLPRDSRPLAVSAAADELLRASWAELTIADAPPPKMQPPAAVLTAVAESVRTPEPPVGARVWELGVHGGASWFPQRLTTVGGGAALSGWFQERWGTTLRLGAGYGLPVEGAHGSVTARTLNGGATLNFAPWPVARPRGLALEAGLTALRFDFVPDAQPGATETRLADWSLQSTVGARGWADLGPLRASVSLAALAGLRPATATDAGETLLSNQGLGGELTLGLSFWL